MPCSMVKNKNNFITIGAEELYQLRKKLILFAYSNAKQEAKSTATL